MFTPEQLNEALQICMEFGPERGIPAEQRVSRRFAALTSQEVAEIVALHDRVINRATTLGGQVIEGKLGFNQAVTALESEFPALDAEVLGRAVNQGCWFAAK